MIYCLCLLFVELFENVFIFINYLLFLEFTAFVFKCKNKMS